MVSLTVTPAAKAAIEAYSRSRTDSNGSREKLSNIEIGDPVEHQELLKISRFLVQQHDLDDSVSKQWRLDTLLKGATLYQPPPPPKPEPTAEYKALMSRLRKEEEQRQYERMLSPSAPLESSRPRFPGIASTELRSDQNELDEVSYQDLNRQVILIINILVSIIACSVAVWIVARRWSVPQRLGLSFSASTIVALAEVAIYMGYLRRIKEAKIVEAKKAEKKEVIGTWIIDAKSTANQSAANDGIRYRKGKHR